MSNKFNEILNIVLIGVGLAMGICVIVTSILKQIDTNSAFIMLGIGLSSFGIYMLKKR